MSDEHELTKEIAELRARVAELEQYGASTLTTLTSHITDNIMLLDRDRRIRLVNWTVPDLTLEDVLGTRPQDHVPAEHRSKIEECFAKVEATRTAHGYEVEYVARDGSISQWETRVAPIVQDGDVDGFAMVSNDVTAQRAAAADRERFFSLSLDLLTVTSFDGHFKRLNPACFELLGWTPAELTERPFLEFVHPDDRLRTERAFESLRHGSDLSDIENRYQCKNGDYRVISWRASVQRNVELVYAVGRDVTSRRELERQLRHSQKMDAVGQLAGGVAHDFNNLLLAILMNADLALKNTAEPAVVERFVREVKASSKRAAELTNKLLTFSRNQPMHLESTRLNELIESFLQILRRLLPEAIELDFIPGHSLPSVQADAGQIEQVLMNLAINARDAMPDGGRLTIETETVVVNGSYRTTHPWAKPGRYVLVTVSDAGHGMTPAVRDRVFEPFFTTKAPGEGTGLGLSLVYGVVQQHAGMVHVYSEPERGTTFKIYLPAGERSAAAVGTKIHGAVPGGSETILLAEDADLVRAVVVRVLEGAGYEVIAAKNGREATELAREAAGPIHLALLDLIMPGLTGPQAYAEIRKVHPGLPALFTSGYSETMAKGIDPSRLLKKPYEPDELLRRVRAILDDVSPRGAGPTPRE